MKIKVFEYVDFDTSDDKLAVFVGVENHSWTKTAWQSDPDNYTYMSFVKTHFGWESVRKGDMVVIDSGEIEVKPQAYSGVITSGKLALRAIQQGSRFTND